ncbi:DNA/RNA non-specific endonuclease [Kribbella sp. CA-247076]|uniref:DNA/RNA non-specific endonuclease n=1 Tax=Kribbella sp. CA-247076 TaxID=3239941 RepID=UPI003D909477
MLAPLRGSGIEPVLAITVDDKGVSGYASVRIGGELLDIKTMSDALGKHAALIGLRGLDSLTLPIAINRLDGPTLILAIEGLSFNIAGFLQGTGTMGLQNEAVTFDASATGTVPGLATITVPIKRDADGSLSGKVKVSLSIKGLGGEIEASYAHGVVDVIGTVRYANEKFDGSVTIAATDMETAKSLATARTPAEVKTVAPAAEGTKPHDGAATPVPASTAPPAATGSGPAPGGAVAAKPGKRVLVGWGTVNVRLADWLTGEASVLVDADADVTIVGKITPRMTGPLFPQRDYKYPLAKIEVRAIYGLPVVGNVFVFANVGLEALAKFGPATLTNLEMTGTWSTKPSVLQSFGLTGTLNISAFAGLRLIAEGGAGLQMLDHDIKIGVALGALAGIRGYVDATPRIGYREIADPQLGKKGEFFLGGHLDIAAQPFLQLGGDLFVDLDSPWWSPAPDKRWTWPLGQLEYPLPGEFGIGADVEHVLGSGKIPEIKFTPVAFDASRFMNDLVNDHVPPKKAPPADNKGTWNETGSQTTTGPAGTPPQINADAARPVAANTGAGVKTPADQAQTPKPETAANVKKAMAVYAGLMEDARTHPASDGEIALLLGKLKSAGFGLVDAVREGARWHVRTSINPKVETQLNAAPSGDEGRPNLKTGARIEFLQASKGPVTVQGLELTTSNGVRMWMIKYTSAKESGARNAFSRGSLTYKVIQPPPVRAAVIHERFDDQRGTLIDAEVGLSPRREVAQQRPGWDVLNAEGRAGWDHAHLLSGTLDGPGLRWNLVLAVRQVNRSEMALYENYLRRNVSEGLRFRFVARVEYHDAGAPGEAEHQQINPAFKITNFARMISIRYWQLKDGGQTPDKSTEKSHLLQGVRLPHLSELTGYDSPGVKAAPPINRGPAKKPDTLG